MNSAARRAGRQAVAAVRRPHRPADAATVTIGITGKYTALRDSYASIIKALEHAGVANDAKVNIKWIDTTDIDRRQRGRGAWPTCDGIIVPGGFGVRGTEGKIACIRYARENKHAVPGHLLGFQMAVIEFARNVCGLAGADSTEINPDCAAPGHRHPARAEEDRGPGRQHAAGRPGRRAQARHAGRASCSTAPDAVRLRFRHRYEVDPRVHRDARRGTAWSSPAGTRSSRSCRFWNCRATCTRTSSARRPTPCLTSRPLRPHPMFVGLVAAAMKRE